MIIYFGASSRNIENDIHKYRRVLNAVRLEGHSISHDWVETAWFMSQGRGRDARGWDLKEIILEAEAGMDAAELVIVEATGVSTLGVGYELAIALQKKKPVLVLVEKEHARNSYAWALQQENLLVKEYAIQGQELEDIVTEFIQQNTINTKDLRFNFVVDRKIFNHLRTKSFKLGKTKAEIVRELLLKDIESK